MGGRQGAPTKSQDAAVAQRDAKPSKSDTPEKPRFDFYKILPAARNRRSPPRRRPSVPTARWPTRRPRRPRKSRRRNVRRKVAAAEPSAAKGAKPGDRFWLQAGSFTQEADAENLRARLALAGWEAQVQSGTLPDKGVRYRVRLGPYDNADELNRIKAQLAQRGFDAAVIKY
jgi:cell division protein FtsN